MILAFLVGPILILLPDTLWERIYHLLLRLKPRRKAAANDLLTFITEKKRSSSLVPATLPQYKFYTDLLVQTLDQARRFGSEIGSLLTEIRSHLIEDQKFERQMRGEVEGAIAQFLMVALITWGFIFSTYLMVEMTPSKAVVCMLLLMQLGGGLVFRKLYRTTKGIAFSPFETYLQGLLSFKALFSVGLPVQQALSRSGITACLEGQLPSINERLKDAILLWKSEGVPIASEIDEALGELSFLLSERYRSFGKKVALYKFLVLALFFLPSYLIYIFSLISSLFAA